MRNTKKILLEQKPAQHKYTNTGTGVIRRDFLATFIVFFWGGTRNQYSGEYVVVASKPPMQLNVKRNNVILYSVVK